MTKKRKYATTTQPKTLKQPLDGFLDEADDDLLSLLDGLWPEQRDEATAAKASNQRPETKIRLDEDELAPAFQVEEAEAERPSAELLDVTVFKSDSAASSGSAADLDPQGDVAGLPGDEAGRIEARKSLIEEARARVEHVNDLITKNEHDGENATRLLIEKFVELHEIFEGDQNALKDFLNQSGTKNHGNTKNQYRRFVQAIASKKTSAPRITQWGEVLWTLIHHLKIPSDQVLVELNKKEPVGERGAKKSGLARMRAIYNLHGPKKSPAHKNQQELPSDLSTDTSAEEDSVEAPSERGLEVVRSLVERASLQGEIEGRKFNVINFVQEGSALKLVAAWTEL
jgi:hypothetical protein